MNRWVSRSSPGRRTSARLRCFWSAISRCSSTIRGSSCRTGSTSIGSSGTWFVGVPRLLAGTVGTFDDLFRHVAGAGAAGHARRVGDPAHARRTPGGRARPAGRAELVGGNRRIRRHAAAGDRGARVGTRRREPARRRPPGARGGVSRTSSRRSGCRIATACAGTRSSGCAAISTHGRESRCSRTGSRISRVPSGRSSKRSLRGPK